MGSNGDGGRVKGWTACRIGQVVEVQQGLCINSKSSHLLEKSGIPLLRITDLINNTQIQFINAQKVNKKFISKKTDLIFTRTGQVGLVFKNRIGVIHNNCFSIIPSSKIYFVFLFYFLKQKTIYEYVNGVAGGAAQPDLGHGPFKSIPFHYPPLPIQRKIAAILSAYDDLIENNNRRIAILEKMAEEIYREWFVRMRFPGHEKVKFHKGVPEGWREARLGRLVRMVMGQSPKSEFYNITGEGLPFNQGVGTYGHRFPRKEVYCTSPGRIAEEGNVLFSVRAPVGRINIADCKMIIGRGLAALTHKRGFNSYLFYMLKYFFSSEDLIGNGAIFSSVGKDELQAFKVLDPEEKLIKSFNDIAGSIDRKIITHAKSKDVLIGTRDLLLSRLITGKLSVEDLDIKFPPSMLSPEPVEGREADA